MLNIKIFSFFYSAKNKRNIFLCQNHVKYTEDYQLTMALGPKTCLVALKNIGYQNPIFRLLANLSLSGPTFIFLLFF